MSIGQLAHERVTHAERVLGARLPVTWDIGPYKHFRTARGFGVTFTQHNNPAWDTCHVRLSAKLLQAPRARQDGIIQHELGHVIDLTFPPHLLDPWAARRGIRLPPQKHGEIRADAIAHAVWGKPLHYDSDTVQSTCCGVTSRPAHLGL